MAPQVLKAPARPRLTLTSAHVVPRHVQRELSEFPDVKSWSLFLRKFLSDFLLTLQREIEMGYLLSKLWWSSEPAGYDVPDEKTGLTPREADLVKGTWNIVKQNVRGNAVELFVRFFTSHPQHQKLFRSFSDVPLDKLKDNGKLLGHATSVIYSFTSLVDNLGDYECLSELLIKITDSHIPRKITAKHFQELSEVIIAFLCDKLGPDVMNERTKEAWIKVTDLVNATIKAEIEKKTASDQQ